MSNFNELIQLKNSIGVKKFRQEFQKELPNEKNSSSEDEGQDSDETEEKQDYIAEEGNCNRQ